MIELARKKIFPILIPLWIIWVIGTAIYINVSGVNIAEKYDYTYVKFDKQVESTTQFYVLSTENLKATTLRDTYFYYYDENGKTVRFSDNDEFSLDYINMNKRISELQAGLYMFSIFILATAGVAFFATFSRSARLQKSGIFILTVVPFMVASLDLYTSYWIYFWAILVAYAFYLFKKARFVDYDESFWVYFKA